MAAATIGALRVVLGLDTAQFETGLTAAQKELRSTGKAMQATGAQIATAGAAMTATISTAFVGLGFHLLKGSQDAAHASGQVSAALDSMGAASGKALPQLQRAAEALRNLTGIDDDEILTKVTSNLLTFGNVAGDVFDRAQLSILNISARMKTDLMGSTMMVGKALNDPIAGLAALRRVGIQFTEQQQAQIKAMAGANDMAGAQAIMLGELERQFGGAAEAAAKADIWTPLKTALMDLEGAFEPLVRNVVGPLIQSFADMTRSLAALSPETQKFILIGGAIAAALGPALIAIGAVVAAAGTLIATLGTGGAMAGVGVAIGAMVPFILPVAAAVAAVVGAFLLFRDDVEPVLRRLWATTQETLGPALGELFATVGDLVRGLAGAWVGFFDGPAGQVISKFAALIVDLLGNSVVRTLTALVSVVEGTLSNIGSMFSILGDLLTGDFAGAWETAKGAVTNTLNMLGGVIEAFWPGAVDSMRKLYEGVKSWLQDKLGGVFTFVGRKVKEAGDAFFNLYDRVVGHSYIPDMVVEVGQWMAKLQENLVNPAERSTKSAADKFRDLRNDVRGIMEGLLTDQERASQRFEREASRLRDAAASGVISPEAAAEFGRRNQSRYNEETTERLTPAGSLTRLSPLTTGDDLREAIGVDRIKERIAEMRDDFADAFANGLDAALRGDWSSVLQIMFGDAMRNSMKNVGSQIFDMLGLGSSGMKSGGGLGNIGSVISSMFGKLPKFATGGSILPSGGGGTDSQLVAFWKSPHERVDIGAPGFNQSGGSPMHFDLRGAVTTADILTQMETMASASGGAAIRGAREVVPRDQAKASRYSLGGGR